MVLKKLQEARLQLQSTKLKKTGHNKFAGYEYFELGDFLPTVQEIFGNLGLCGVISFATDLATLTITDVDDGTSVSITSPMAEANLKGCHPIQNLGAVETYTRRYLWVTAMEIVEHDALDATTGSGNKTITPTTGAFEELDEEEQRFLMGIADEVKALMFNGDIVAAVERIKNANLDAEEKVALWTRFDSKERAAMKKEMAKKPVVEAVLP